MLSQIPNDPVAPIRPRTYRVGVVDDHMVVLIGLSEILGANEGYEVVSTGNSAESLVAMAAQGDLDLIITDLYLKNEIFDAIETVASMPGAPPLLVFTASDKVDDCCTAMSCGARGVVVKGSKSSELFQAIEQVIVGNEYISSVIATQVIRKMNHPGNPKVALTYREDQIVSHLLHGATNKDIAGHLKISEKTVKYYMTQILQKFDARNRVEVVLAIQRQRGSA